MRFLVKTILNDSSATQIFQDKQFETKEITLGRDKDQDIVLDNITVSPQHAQIIQAKNNSFRIFSNSDTFLFRDKPVNEAIVQLGDFVIIGNYKITSVPASPDHDAACAIQILPKKNESVMATTLEDYKRIFSVKTPSIRAWSWFFGLSTLIIGLLLPLTGVFNWQFQESLREITGAPSDFLWQTGPLAAGHKTPEINQNCNVCHEKPFVMVEDKSCITCHDDMTTHRENSKSGHILGQRCASCHREHNESTQIIVNKDEPCTDCHRSLETKDAETKLRNVGNFSKDHPDFLISLLVQKSNKDWELLRNSINSPILKEKSNLLFDHKVHLVEKGIDSPSGNQVMKCADCHQADAANINMLPITMEEHCSNCHLLIFDENDLTREVTHGKPEEVLQELEEYYSRIALFGKPINSNTEKRRKTRRPGKNKKQVSNNTSKDARKNAQQSATTIFEKSVCVTCHIITKNKKNSQSPWKVKPVRLNQTWMPKSYFNHKSHNKSACTDCHDAKKSVTAEDILMPKIKVCRNCHGDSNTKNKLTSTCIDCHKLHIPGNNILITNNKKSDISMVTKQ